MPRISARPWLRVAFDLLVVTALRDPELAGAADVTVGLDQYQTAQNTSGMVGSGGGVGEVFTAGQSGYLAGVSLYLEQYAPNPTTAVNIVIQTVTSDGLPSGTSIGSGWIPVETIPADGGWVDAEITGAFVTANTRYALLLSTMNGIVLWHSASGDVKPYARGYWVDKASGVWVKILTNQDWTFKTYVAPDTLDQDQSQTSGSGVGTRALGTTPVGQTFTVGLYGMLERVSVYLTNSSTSPGPITVTVLEVTSSGLPAIGTQVSAGNIPAEAIPKPGYRNWVSAAIKPFIARSGTQYALLLSTTVSGPQWVLVSDVYAGGTGLIRSGTSWTTASDDFAFRTYVLEPILDQSQTRADFYQGNGDPPNQYAQSFTAGLSGNIDRVWVALDGTDEYTVSIHPYWGLDGAPIGTVTIPYSSYRGWTIVAFDGVYVTAGAQYFLKVYAPSPEGSFGFALSPLGGWYPGGTAFYTIFGHWLPETGEDLTFKTYVLPVLPWTTAPGPGGIMPCLDGVCPAASGGFTPADLTEGVMSHFQFQERPDGTVQGILNFSDPRPDGIELHGCTTQSAACALTVTALTCTDAQSLIVRGTYTPRGGTATGYRLTVSGFRDGPGTFSLTSGDYSFTHTLDGMVSVTCPSITGP